MPEKVMHILFVEDEVKVARIIEAYLLKSGYSVDTLHTGADVVETVRESEPDLILLDIMLPEVDGITICQEIRAFSNVPIILLTAKVEEVDRILGYDIGADDYICKPVNPREILARVKAALRRAGPATPRKSESVLEFDDSRLLATYRGQRLDLTLKEFQLLKLLYSGSGKIFSRQQIKKKVYGGTKGEYRTVDNCIKKLRDKISSAAKGESPIRSVYGAGYSFELPNDDSEA